MTPQQICCLYIREWKRLVAPLPIRGDAHILIRGQKIDNLRLVRAHHRQLVFVEDAFWSAVSELARFCPEVDTQVFQFCNDPSNEHDWTFYRSWERSRLL